MSYTKDKIFDILKDKKISQQAFAEGIGVTKQTVSNWKSGISDSYIKIIDQIAHFLDVPVEEFFDRKDSLSKDTSMRQLAEQASHIAGYADKKAPVDKNRSTISELFKVFSTDEIKQLSSLSRDEAAQVVKMIQEFPGKK